MRMDSVGLRLLVVNPRGHASNEIWRNVVHGKSLCDGSAALLHLVLTVLVVVVIANLHVLEACERIVR
jgi:hypothetical protein